MGFPEARYPKKPGNAYLCRHYEPIFFNAQVFMDRGSQDTLLSRKTLILITQDFPPSFGGIQNYSVQLGRRFSRVFKKVVVVAPWLKGCEAWDEGQPFDVVRIRTQSRLLGWVLRHRMKQLLDKYRPDLLFHTQWNTLAAAKKARKCGFEGSIICAAHGWELLREPELPFPVPQIFRKYRTEYLQLPVLWLPVSRYSDQLLDDLGIPAPSRVIMHNGTNPAHFRDDDDAQTRAETRRSFSLQADDFVLLTTARIVAQKGIDTVIEALGLLAPDYPRLRYLIIGDGVERPALEAQVRKAGLTERVRFAGNVTYGQLPHIYQAADVFVMVPKTLLPVVEGYGIVYLEANACGLPVIGSTSGGVPDAVLHNETGLLVPEQNPAELAAAIESLIKAPDKRRKFGQNGRKRVLAQNNWDAVSQNMLTLFQQL